ncbi:hypothetical protein Tco_1117025 [Tanacetum coccineum]
MRTRSQSRNLNRQQQQAPPAFVEPFNLEEPIENPAPPVVTMDDTRTMAQLLEAPTEGYEDAIVVPEITADNFELKHGLLTLVQNKQFFGHDKEDPHAHIRYFNKITSTMKFPNVPIVIDVNKPVVAKVSSSSSTPGISPDVAELKDMVKALLLDKKSQAPTPVKAVEESCVTCGGAHSYRNCPATNGNIYRDNIQEYVSQAAAVNYNPGNTGYRAPIANQIRPPDLKGITTRSGVAYQGPTIPTTYSSPKVVERETEVTKYTMPPTNNGSTKDVQPPVVQVQPQVPNFEPVVALVPNLKPTIPYLSRRNDERRREKANDQIEKFYEIFKDLKVLGFSDLIASGNPTPYYDPVVSTSSPTLTPSGDSDFILLEEADAFLALEDDPTSPEVELKDLPPHLEYAFLEGDDKLPVIIAKDLSIEEKSALIMVLKSRKQAIAWKLSDIKDKMLQRCEDTNLCLNWEKSHFMVKEGIVLSHKISKNRIEVDKAKIDVIAKLPHPTTVKGVRSFLDHSAVKYLFAKKDSKARLLRWVLLLQEFKFKVINTKGAENLAADHLSRLENPYENVLDPKEINETFPIETLNMVTFRGDSSTPWFADYANYHAGNFIVKGMS